MDDATDTTWKKMPGCSGFVTNFQAGIGIVVITEVNSLLQYHFRDTRSRRTIEEIIRKGWTKEQIFVGFTALLPDTPGEFRSRSTVPLFACDIKFLSPGEEHYSTCKYTFYDFTFDQYLGWKPLNSPPFKNQLVRHYEIQRYQSIALHNIHESDDEIQPRVQQLHLAPIVTPSSRQLHVDVNNRSKPSPRASVFAARRLPTKSDQQLLNSQYHNAHQANQSMIENMTTQFEQDCSIDGRADAPSENVIARDSGGNVFVGDSNEDVFVRNPNEGVIVRDQGRITPLPQDVLDVSVPQSAEPELQPNVQEEQSQYDARIPCLLDATSEEYLSDKRVRMYLELAYSSDVPYRKLTSDQKSEMMLAWYRCPLAMAREGYPYMVYGILIQKLPADTQWYMYSHRIGLVPVPSDYLNATSTDYQVAYAYCVAEDTYNHWEFDKVVPRCFRSKKFGKTDIYGARDSKTEHLSMRAIGLLAVAPSLDAIHLKNEHTWKLWNDMLGWCEVRPGSAGQIRKKNATFDPTLSNVLFDAQMTGSADKVVGWAVVHMEHYSHNASMAVLATDQEELTRYCIFLEDLEFHEQHRDIFIFFSSQLNNYIQVHRDHFYKKKFPAAVGDKFAGIIFPKFNGPHRRWCGMAIAHADETEVWRNPGSPWRHLGLRLALKRR